jgi:S-DNA-T family DNA segregation ATPase FtsK/SpoIIIE
MPENNRDPAGSGSSPAALLTVVVRAGTEEPPQVPRGEIALEPPPELPEAGQDGFGQTLMYLPMAAMAIGMVAVVAGGHASPILYIGSGAMAIGMAGMTLGQVVRGKGDRKVKLNGLRRDYLRYLAQARRKVRRAAAQQRQAMEWHGPQPGALASLLAAGYDGAGYDGAGYDGAGYATGYEGAAAGRDYQSAILWRRRSGDPDFLQVRFATGTQQLAIRLVTPQTKPLEDLDPLCSGALRRFLITHAQVAELPVEASLRSVSRVVLADEQGGDDERDRDERDRDERGGEAAAGLVRSMILQIAVAHSPADVRICVCAPATRIGAWEWVKWLPHNAHPAEADAAGPVRLMAPSLAWLGRMLEPGLRERPRFSPEGTAGSLPCYVVIADGGGAARQSPDASAFTGVDGVVLIDLSAPPASGYEPATLGLRISQGQLYRMARDAVGHPAQTPLGVPDTLSRAEAEALARQLAPLRPAAAGPAADDPLAASSTLTALLGIADPLALDVPALWRRTTGRDRLRVPIGTDAAGQPVELDIKESAQGGMGPHGLIVGATGSGKSELLRTLVLGLALTHFAEDLNFVLVDFKGGATFGGLEKLPHVAAVITNLADELPLVDRMQDALRGEVVRRQEVLRAAGNYASLRDYARARAQGADLAPMPTLFVVLDEFSELVTAKPEFTDLFVTISRVGRSLGVHLLLASQRLEEGRLRGLETQLSYRIGLRTFSALESRAVLGVPDACELPAQPGHGYLKIDSTELTRFRAAYVSGPAASGAAGGAAGEAGRAGTGRAGAGLVRAEIVPFGPAYIKPHVRTAGAVEALAGETPDEARADGAGTRGATGAAPGEALTGEALTGEARAGGARPASLFDAVIAQLAGTGPAAHQIWLPPLDVSPTLGQLLPELVVDPQRGLTVGDPALRGTLTALLGIVDKPFEQRRDPLRADLSGSAGHLAVVGAPRSGKSTVLRTLICSLALLHTPVEAQFYLLDFGGGTLAPLTGLPQVGGMASGRQRDRVRRMVAELRALLEHREREFAEHGVDSIVAYRRLRARGEITGDGFGDVFLVVDGWLTLRQDFEELEAPVTALAARGLGYGLHLVAATSKWSEFRPAVRDLFGTRLELRLGDPYESAVGRRAAENVPEGAPGRGVTRDGLHFLAALPSIDRPGTDRPQGAAGMPEAVRRLAADLSRAWPGPAAPAVRMLPDVLPASELPPPDELPAASEPPGGPGGAVVPFGLDEATLSPVGADFGADPHFLILGDTECGKSNLVRLLAEGIMASRSPGQARLVFIDYRRSLLDCAESEHTIGYLTSSVTAAPTMQEVRAALIRRLPPPDLNPAQLRARSWWSGADLFLVVDDYDLVAGPNNPVTALAELLPQARDIGLHVILARSAGGAGRAMFDPVIQRLKEMGSPGMIMSGSADEGQLLGGVRPAQQPAGRGFLVQRRTGSRLVQTALLEAAPLRQGSPEEDGVHVNFVGT